jgi:hypothetical protein
MDEMVIPRPTCFGFTPPRFSSGFAAPDSVCDIISWKVTRLVLKP